MLAMRKFCRRSPISSVIGSNPIILSWTVSWMPDHSALAAAFRDSAMASDARLLLSTVPTPATARDSTEMKSATCSIRRIVARAADTLRLL